MTRAEQAAQKAYPINSTSKKNRAVQVGRIIAFRKGYEQAEKHLLAKAEELIAEAIKKYDEGGDRFWLGARYAAIEIRDMINENK